MCPACWPAYASLLSSVGLGFLVSTTYLLPLTALFLIVAVASLGFLASARRGLGPFWMGVAAGDLIPGGKFYRESTPVTDAGIGFLIAASIWNSWPRPAASADFCAACAPAEHGIIGEP
jgi:hypothetical protein